MRFGDRLRMLREEKGWTQKEFGERISTSDRVVGYWESNDRFPKDDEILKSIADIFDVSVDFLIGRTESRKHVVDLPEDYKVDPDKLQVFARASRALPEEEMKKIREYAAMLIDKHIREEREKKKKE